MIYLKKSVKKSFKIGYYVMWQHFILRMSWGLRFCNKIKINKKFVIVFLTKQKKWGKKCDFLYHIKILCHFSSFINKIKWKCILNRKIYNFGVLFLWIFISHTISCFLHNMTTSKMSLYHYTFKSSRTTNKN